MYPKGANLLHTLRTIINNDEKWRQILRGINENFRFKTCTTQEVENYISQQAGINFKPIFDQYLRHVQIPVLEYKLAGNRLSYRWDAEVANFNMPVNIQVNAQKSIVLKAGTKLKTIKIKDLDAAQFKIDDFNFYIQTKKLN